MFSLSSPSFYASVRTLQKLQKTEKTDACVKVTLSPTPSDFFYQVKGYVPPVRVSMPSAFHPNTIATPATLHCSRVDARTHASTRQSPSMKHEGRREGVSPAFHGLSRERKGNDRGVVIPLCRLPRQGRSGPFLTVPESC